jgi:hypothetical protein
MSTASDALKKPLTSKDASHPQMTGHTAYMWHYSAAPEDTHIMKLLFITCASQVPQKWG